MTKVTFEADTLLYPMPAVLVGTMVDDKPTFMTAAWCTIAAAKPPSIAVAIRKERYTLIGILAHQTFSVNVASAAQAREVDFCGIYSGHREDKSQLFECFFGTLDTAPLIRACPINQECRLIHTLELGSHTLVVGQIAATHIDEECLTEGLADPAKIDPLIYSPGTRHYQRLGEVVGKAFHIGKKA